MTLKRLTMTKCFRAFAMTLVVAGLLSLAGCGARSAETRNPNVVVAGWIAGPDSMNPMVSVATASAMVQDLIFSRIVDLGPNLLPRWQTSFASKVDITEGGTRYILHLRRNGKWSDGVPMTAKDVVFTLFLHMNAALLNPHTAAFALMKSARAIDPYTVEVRLSKPSPPFLLNALADYGWILPEHVLDKYPPQSEQEAKFVNADTDFSQHPVIGGPWRIVRNVRDSYLLIAPNPLYWGPKPFLQEIAFRVYPEQDSLYAAVDAGEVDVVDIPPNLWRIHNRLTGKHRFVTWPWNVTFVLLPNYHDPAIQWIPSPAIKRAMMYAIDRKFIISGIMSGQADVLNGPIPSFSPYYDPRVRTYGYDPAKARALLDSAGWHEHGSVRMKDGKTLRVTLKTGGATDAVAANVAELIQANLRAVGIDCELENEEIQTFYQDLHNSRFELALRGVILPPYPDDFQVYDSHETRTNGGLNVGFYSNSGIDQAIETARTAPNFAVSRAALNRYQELASADLPVIYLFSNRLGAVVPPNLTGYDLDPLSAAALPTGLQFWRFAR
jgi:peptide/nickel transport system substrate-binding protein